MLTQFVERVFVMEILMGIRSLVDESVMLISMKVW